MKIINDNNEEIKIEDIKMININNNETIFIKMTKDDVSNNFDNFYSLINDLTKFLSKKIVVIYNDVEILKGEKII
jgi:hypothetical protein